MNKIKKQDIAKFAFVSTKFTIKPYRRLIVGFPGLGSTEMRSGLDMEALENLEQGVLYVSPYVNPWNWMNQKTVEFVDMLLESVTKSLKIEGIPLITVGGSMGGYSALAYPMFSKLMFSASMAFCPVCDLHHSYSERDDIPRTLCDAFGYGDIGELLKERSPLHNVARMPDLKYLIVHGSRDKLVSKAAHSDKLVRAMRKRKLQLTYIEDPLMEHGAPISVSTMRAIKKFSATIL
ncbi:MAG: prolyl oligopeptidase family serine peptidase [Planctomycetes bacterium]|nr:prolyl oligopeptidase family serine peptidase [Planctomycetota bacterium]